MSEGKRKNALKAGVWYTISSVMVKAIAIISTPIFTRLLSTSDYGIASTFTSWYTLLLVFASMNLTYSIGRAKLDFPGKLKEYVGSMQTLSALFTLAMGVIAVIFIKPISHFMEMDTILVVLLFVYLLFSPAISFTQSNFRYEYKYKGNIAITIFITISTVVAGLIFIFIFKDNRYIGKILGSLVPCLILSIAFWISNIKNKQISINTEYWKYGLAISLPLILHTVSLNILSTSDRIFITKYCGTNFTGIYSLAYSYAILINIVTQAVNEAWLPWFHDTFFEGDYEAIRKNVRPLIMLGCFMGIGCIALAPEAMAILGPPEYASGVMVVAPVTLGVVCQYIYQQYVHIELHLKKTSFISAGTMLAALLNIILNIIFVPRFGFIAAAYSTLFSYFLLMVVHLFITKRILKISIYNNIFMFLSLAVVAGVSAVFMLLYDYLLIRLFLLVLVSIIYLFINKTYVINFLNKRKLKKKVKTENQSK